MPHLYHRVNALHGADRGAKRPNSTLLYQGSACLVIALLLSSLSGCSSATPTVAPAIATDPHTLPPYVIQPGDQMDVKFYNVAELNESLTVRPDGRVSLELAHDVRAAGLTPEQLSMSLTQSYSRELNNPRVTVIMRTFTSERVYVQGEVNSPKLVPLAAKLTLLQSISEAGGLKDTARTNEIVIIRRDAEGKPFAFKADISDVLEGENPSQDIALMPFDIVYVPKTAIANVNTWIDTYIRQNVPISIGFAYDLGQ